MKLFHNAMISAVLVLPTTGAFAYTQHVLALDGQCDQLTVTSQMGGKIVWSVAENDSCNIAYGVGAVGKVASLGGVKYVTMGTDYTSNFIHPIWNLQFQYPFATGLSWVLQYSDDGVNFTKYNSGTYTLLTAGAKHPRAGKPAIFGR